MAKKAAVATGLEWVQIDVMTDAHGICRKTEAANLPEMGVLFRYTERQFKEGQSGAWLDSTASVAFSPYHRVVDGDLEFHAPQ